MAGIIPPIPPATIPVFTLASAPIVRYRRNRTEAVQTPLFPVGGTRLTYENTINWRDFGGMPSMIDTATIERLARESGLPEQWIGQHGVIQWTRLSRFAALVADHERERCAKAVELMSLRTDDSEGATNALKWAAEDIRAL